MSDVNTLVFQPLQQFFKNSVHLVKKCTKPDRKGAFCFDQLPCILRVTL